MNHQRKLTLTLFIAMLLFVFALPLAAAEQKININKASVQELTQLKGIGQKGAQRIVEYRDANGPFTAPEDLMKVKGVGEKLFEHNKKYITVE